MESLVEDEKDVWVSGRRLAKVLDARYGGVCIYPWKDLLPGLQHGELLCACRNASIFDLVKSHTPFGYYRPDGVEPVETRQDWKILAKAWQTSSKISGGLHGFKSRFQYCALDTETNLSFLDRSDVVEVITTGVTFNRASIVDYLELTPEEVIILDGGEAKQDGTQHETQSLPLKLERVSGTGANTDAVRWAQYGAASAQLSDEELKEWAKSAADRSVSQTDARVDALAILKDKAPTQDECRAALRSEKQQRGITVRPGRPHGSKSFAKK
jgi:hypothetical protein